MLRGTLILVLTALMVFGAGVARAHEFGLGAVIGEPTGINGKIWTGDATAVDFALAWELDNNDAFNIHMDYLWHDYGVFNVTKGRLPLYYGIGGRMLDHFDTHVGMRGVIGLNYLFARSPVDIFFEVAPVLDFVPDTDMDLEAGVGMRFYFR
jgi:hypothetical protein